MYRFTGGSRLQEARAYAGGEARAQLHDGHTINEKGKAVAYIRGISILALSDLCVNSSLVAS